MSFIDKDRKMEINCIKSQGVHTYTVHRRSQRIPGIVFFLNNIIQVISYYLQCKIYLNIFNFYTKWLRGFKKELSGFFHSNECRMDGKVFINVKLFSKVKRRNGEHMRQNTIKFVLMWPWCHNVKHSKILNIVRFWKSTG